MQKKLGCVILGGGRGRRLQPLTHARAKPAVPFGGRYRLVDVPLSNCLRAKFFNIYLLTQFNSVSLHSHVHQVYRLDKFNDGRIDFLPARQQPKTNTDGDWYLGSADAVRKNFDYINTHGYQDLLIMSGDQLCNIDLQAMYRQHRESNADFTIATTAIGPQQAHRYGVVRFSAHPRKKIVDFCEKPNNEQLESYLIPSDNANKAFCYASMGIYIIRSSILNRLLDNRLSDFGRDIIPLSIEQCRVFGFTYSGFFEDIGTIKSFYQANIGLSRLDSGFDLHNSPYLHGMERNDLPPTRISGAHINNSLIAEGCSLSLGCVIESSVLGVGVEIARNSRLEGVYHMGSDHYAFPNYQTGGVIGKNCHVRRCIMDSNASIGDGCRIGLRKSYENFHGSDYSICDNIIVIRQGVSLPDNTII